MIYIYIYITKYEIFLQWNTKFFTNFCFSILHLAKTVSTLRIMSQKFTRNFVIQEFRALENHVFVNMLLMLLGEYCLCYLRMCYLCYFNMILGERFHIGKYCKRSEWLIVLFTESPDGSYRLSKWNQTIKQLIKLIYVVKCLTNVRRTA